MEQHNPGDILTMADGSRRKVRNDLKLAILCNGKDNECLKEARVNGLCAGCRGGVDRTIFRDRAEGEVFDGIGGKKYRFIGGQSRRLCDMCVAEDIPAPSLADDASGLCSGHKVGKKRHKLADLEVGQIVEDNGVRKRNNGKRLIKLCAFGDGRTCDNYADGEGLCKSHNPAYRCQSPGCEKIRVGGDFCVAHR